jgi:hypothetical protein
VFGNIQDFDEETPFSDVAQRTNHKTNVRSIEGWEVEGTVLGLLPKTGFRVGGDEHSGYTTRELVNIVACLLKARIVKPAQTAVARERFCKHARW